MEQRWSLFLAHKLMELRDRAGHRQVRTLLQEDTDLTHMGRDARLRDREARLPR
jgi:hypothetical protein